MYSRKSSRGLITDDSEVLPRKQLKHFRRSATSTDTAGGAGFTAVTCRGHNAAQAALSLLNNLEHFLQQRYAAVLKDQVERTVWQAGVLFGAGWLRDDGAGEGSGATRAVGVVRGE